MATTRATSSKPKAKSLAEIVADATPFDVVVPVCVAGHLHTEHERIQRELDEIEEERLGAGSAKLSDPQKAEVDKLVTRANRIKEQIRTNTYEFVFRKLPRNEWLALVDEHPPREGKERLERWNRATFMPAAVKASCVAPEGMNEAETFQNLWDNILNEGQRAELFMQGAFRANEESLSVPLSVSAFAPQQSSEPN